MHIYMSIELLILFNKEDIQLKCIKSSYSFGSTVSIYMRNIFTTTPHYTKLNMLSVEYIFQRFISYFTVIHATSFGATVTNDPQIELFHY